MSDSITPKNLNSMKIWIQIPIFKFRNRVKCTVHSSNKCCISTTTLPMANKLGRIVVTYLNGVLPIKSNDPLITLSYKIIWQTKIIYIFTTIAPPNLEGWQITLMGSYFWSQMNLWSRGLAISCDSTTKVSMATTPGKLVTSIPNVTLLFGRMILRDHMTN